MRSASMLCLLRNEEKRFALEWVPELNEQSYISTARVAKALGVGVTTIKRWVDEGILPAHKTAGGHRKLLLADVLHLVRERHFPCLDLAYLNVQPGDAKSLNPKELSDQLYAALRYGNEEATRNLIHQSFLGQMALETLADQVIAPAMSRIGLDWERGRIDVLHEHRGTQLCTSALYELQPKIDARAQRDRPLAVGGTPDENLHALGSLLAEFILRDAGWQAVNLGASTPIASFRRALLELRPKLLWLSITYLPEPAQFLRDYGILFEEARQLGVAVAVGGRALTTEVRSAMPYTTFGDGLSHLAAFARSLHPQRRPRPRGRPAVVGR
jgi:MerR family transcriptional regulator, light-induced transcriptional regulator